MAQDGTMPQVTQALVPPYKKELYPLSMPPKIKHPRGEGWSVDIMLVMGDTKVRGYYDPKASIAGGDYLFYNEEGKIGRCGTLPKRPTHWHYMEKKKRRR